ncbi:cation diffusion facilitator family transporter [Sphingomonadaceae bacterium G21617-S1]|uniref:cation diffusion facilitator family transporter n=1 Tax=Rhizorhabdus sp. TaxID=1968843 RepID=UPI0019B23994|nr:cation diffusion facilitator family transporter [Rhizorhabdus sp.]MBD3760182.1 cation diffusion facilitator family transporter [Rhizorhabdus sp.]MCZ4342958.1 cation diffusion facilitator family transporter [Sphingomonadaceae bacterium G21617-S1]
MSLHANQRAAIASVSVATILILLKGYASWTTGSAAVLGSFADTALDLIASLVTLYSVRLAVMPADRQHSFGHGKAEAIAAFFQVVLISLSAFWIIIHSVQQLIGGARPQQAEAGILVSVIALALTLLLVTYQRKVIEQTGSLAIGTDRVHYTSDLLLNAAVIAALLIERWAGIGGADAVAGIGIGLWLLFGAYSASRNAIDELMDREWPEERRRAFLEVANRHPELRGIHDLRTRTAGHRDFVQFHVWVDPDMTVGDAHRVMDEVEAQLNEDFPGVEILIHPDPAGHVDEGKEALA